MKQYNKKKYVFLSIILMVSLLVGSIQIGFPAKAEASASDGMKLLASTTDKIPWTTYATALEASTVTLDTPVSLTTLRIQITELSDWKLYIIYEIEIYDENGVNIAPNAKASVYGSMITTANRGANRVNDGEYETADDWSYLKRTEASTKTPTDEYLEFKFNEEVKVSSVTLNCKWCNNGEEGGDAPFGWRIWGNPSDAASGFSLVGEMNDIAWTSNDTTAEERILAFDTSISTDRLRVYINKINKYFNYSIIELRIFDENGVNIASEATLTDSAGTSASNIGELTDGSLKGNSGKYNRENLPSQTLFNEYIEFKFDEIVNIKDVRMNCWYGNSALTAFSVYAQVYEPAVVLSDDEYKIDSANNIISCVPVGTTVLEMINKLDSSMLYGNSVGIYDGNGTTPLSATTELKTGDVLRIYQGESVYKEYQIAVFGDVDGDGQATIADTVYTEKNLDSLTTLQTYAASLNGWNVIGASGAVDWQIGGDVVDARVIEFDVIPENITSLRVRINVAGLYDNYQIFEIKMYGPDGTNLAKTAEVTAPTHMPQEKLDLIKNEKLDSAPFTSNTFSVNKAGLENEYFDFTWSEPVTVCSMELINKWAKSTAPKDFDILYEFGTAEEETSEILVNHAVLEAYQPEEQLYSDEYVQAVADKVNAHSGLTFTFVTDTHIDANATYGNPSLNHLSNATRVSNLLSVDAIVHGGDLIDGLYNKYRSLNYITDAVSTLVTESSVPVLMTQGNHDDNSPYLQLVENTPEQYTTADEWYWTVTRNLEQYDIVQNPDDLNGNYYYVDFESEKIRMLVVNTNDLPYVLNDAGEVTYLSSSGRFAISNEQLNWIATEALDFSEKQDWELVVISHVSLHNPTTSENQPCINSWALTDMLEAFQKGSSFAAAEQTFSYTDSNQETVVTSDFAYSVSADFTAQGARDVIACIAGHNHADRSREINDILYITTAASLANQRAYGTTEEDAFDIFTIDTANRKIYATRFGAGEDREFTY